jgi:hypothetical protein
VPKEQIRGKDTEKEIINGLSGITNKVFGNNSAQGKL